MEPGGKSRLAWPGLPAWSLETTALLTSSILGTALLIRRAVSP
jgi:hypothetical protein